ncbi:hypothetical protein HYC85_014076 [Camellia sinensis]|uniref:Uncharacterized protein n=1 Tax=Camellia sinensis TaxID=4442 RepID=A0A7J7H5E6_CAMSI|nr:hypothetical protein HYC85_014076 [Camellia sinensis]
MLKGIMNYQQRQKPSFPQQLHNGIRNSMHASCNSWPPPYEAKGIYRMYEIWTSCFSEIYAISRDLASYIPINHLCSDAVLLQAIADRNVNQYPIKENKLENKRPPCLDLEPFIDDGKPYRKEENINKKRGMMQAITWQHQTKTLLVRNQ